MTGEPCQTPALISQRFPSTTVRPGHGQRQVTIDNEVGNLAFFKITESWEETEYSLIKALRRMVIKASNHFYPKRDTKFKTWLGHTEFYLSVIKCPEKDKTSFLLLLEVNSFEVYKQLDIKSDTEYWVAIQKLKYYFAITETNEELRDKLDLCFQESKETIETYAWNIKLIGHKA